MRLITFLLLAIMMIAQCGSEPGVQKIRIIAHRGASAYAPENTVAAFRKAAELGAAWFELDVHLSADGVPVVIHDNSVDRTTNGTGKIPEMSLAEIKELDAGCRFDSSFAGERIPTLDEALAFAKGRINVYIEIKDINPALPARILELTAKHRMKDNVVIQSFSLDQLTVTRNLDKSIAIEYLIGDYQEIDLQKAISVGARSINPSYKNLTSEIVEAIHRLGMTVVPYTIDDPSDMKRLIAMNVDGIITNKPDVARAAAAD